MDHVGRYELLGVVADRGHGRVWKGRDPELDRPVAVKQVPTSDPIALARLRSEAQILAALDDPHIVTVFDVLDSDQSVWLVEEWVDGASLDAVSRQARRLTGPQAVGVVTGALSGLAGAHRHEIVHGDVTPGNILVDQAGTSKLVDFGLAGPSGVLQSSGTPGYLSPEAARGTGLTPRSDVYSSAAVLATLLLGRPLFASTTAGETVARQLSPEPPDLGGVSEHLRTVLSRALLTEPQGRHSDATELLADLQQAAERDLGAGWLGQASVAGLVAAAVTAEGVREAKDSPSVAAAAAIVAPPQQPARRRLGGRKVALAAATAGVVVVAAVVAAVASNSGGKSSAGASTKSASSTTVAAATTTAAATRTAAATPAVTTTVAVVASTPAPTPSSVSPSAPASTTSPSPTPRAKILTVAQSFSGHYRLDNVVTAITGTLTSPAVGSRDSVVWRVTATCRPTCTATVVSSSGATWRLTYKSGTWSGVGGFTDCLDTAGKAIPGTVRSDAAVMHLKAPKPTTRPTTKLTGTQVFTISKGVPGCNGTHGTWVESVTLTRM